jgi:hypothetical protein
LFLSTPSFFLLKLQISTVWIDRIAAHRSVVTVVNTFLGLGHL